MFWVCKGDVPILPDTLKEQASSNGCVPWQITMKSWNYGFCLKSSVDIKLKNEFLLSTAWPVLHGAYSDHKL